MNGSMQPSLAPQVITAETLAEKYARDGERTTDDVRRRVARALSAREPDPSRWATRFLETQRRGFIAGGRINAAAGTALRATLINCFVQPIGDSISATVDGKPGIYVALQQATETMRRGGGAGYDFSAIRPWGALVKGTQSRASGPVSYMHVFDRSCETVESAGARRGAQMGMLRVDHPDIESFVHAKDRPGDLENFNVSVSASDAFMRAVLNDRIFELVHKAEPAEDILSSGAFRRDDGLWVYRRLPARRLFRDVMERTYAHGDPGIVFTDTVNRENILHYAETIEATNPCGEQPLPAYGCCCLGSLDLTRFVSQPFSPAAHFDFASLVSLVPTCVRMLDNVLDLSVWPLPQQGQEAAAKRRIGLGFTGLGDALVMLGLRYDHEAARSMAAAIAQRLRDAAYKASVALAREKGPFPLFDAQRFLHSPFAQRLPAEVREQIRGHGLRNSHLLSVAPTGTISLAFADNASNGIAPAYDWSYTRTRRLPDGAFTSTRSKIMPISYSATSSVPTRSCPGPLSPHWRSARRHNWRWWQPLHRTSTPTSAKP